jgi:hypothetical protein
LSAGRDEIQAARLHRPHLVQRPVLDHQAQPGVAAVVELGAGRIEHRRRARFPSAQGRLGVGLPGGQRLAGGDGHGMGAEQALAVADLDTGLSAAGSNCGQHVAKFRLALGGEKQGGDFALGLGHRRDVGQAVSQGA